MARGIRSSIARAGFFEREDINRDMRQSLNRLICDESGQDLIEYGLLASILSIAGVLLFPSIKAAMDSNFANWGTKVYDLWVPKDPGS